MKVVSTSAVSQAVRKYTGMDSTLRGVVHNGEGLRNVVAAKRQQPQNNCMALALQLFGETMQQHRKLLRANSNVMLHPSILQIGVKTSDWLLYNPTKVFVNHNVIFDKEAKPIVGAGSVVKKTVAELEDLLRLIKETTHLDRPASRSDEAYDMRCSLSGDDNIIFTSDEFAPDTRGVQNIAGMLQNALQKIRTSSNK